MLSLDKVQLLEERIRKAVALINRLREENQSLNEQVSILKMHNEELKDFAKNYNQDTALIEQGIAKSLAHLEQIDGLNEVTPVEDLMRFQEFAEFDAENDQTFSSVDEQTSEGVQEEIPVGYEDAADPLV